LYPARTGVELPDLVVSGMNAGANAGVNVAYSGTVAAAMEAAFHGVPAIAVSLMLGGGPPNFTRAAEIADTWLPELIAKAQADTVLNLNLPPVRTDDTPVMPLSVCRVNRSVHDSRYERRDTPWGEDYYWILGSGISFREVEPGSDVEALNAGRASLSPLRWDPVCDASMDGLKNAF
jgi:5'-nucleotidase